MGYNVASDSQEEERRRFFLGGWGGSSSARPEFPRGGLVGGCRETSANLFSLARQSRHLPRVLDLRVNGRRARCLPLRVVGER